MTARRGRTLETDVSRILKAIEATAVPTDAPTLVLTTGLPGSGKSTVSRRITCRRPVSEHWNIDASDAAATEAALSRVVEACRPRVPAGETGGAS